MKNLFKKFMGEKRGDVVQYIIVLAVIVVILIFAFPKIKDAMKSSTDKAMTDIGKTNSDIPGTTRP